MALRVLERNMGEGAREIRRPRGVEKNHENRFSRERFQKAVFRLHVSITCFQKAIFKT